MCDFPAKKLLDEQRRVCREADESHDMAKIHRAAQYVQGTYRLRICHEELTGCKCWYEAVEEFDHAESSR